MHTWLTGTAHWLTETAHRSPETAQVAQVCRLRRARGVGLGEDGSGREVGLGAGRAEMAGDGGQREVRAAGEGCVRRGFGAGLVAEERAAGSLGQGSASDLMRAP